MPSLHGGKKRKSTRGRKSPGRKVSRKSPGRKVSRKSGRKGRRVRGGGAANYVERGAAAVGYGGVAGDLGYNAGGWIGKQIGSGNEAIGSKVGAGLAGLAGAAYGMQPMGKGRTPYNA